jgi:hypothetical protein
MNYKLADEVKSVKKDKREAIKSYDKSKEAAAKHLEKLQLEKEEKNELKDKLMQALKAQELQQNEILRLLKAQEAQHNLLEEYKNMIEHLKSSKLNLKREFKVGHQGGLIWLLWVLEVCCELLVNGSPPSAIPASIGILISVLYGKEPKKLLSLNFVRQCQVII